MKKRKKAIVNDGPWLFTEEEMAGKIENVTITPDSSEENVVTSEPTDDRIVNEMVKVMRQLNLMAESNIRLIALSTTMIGQEGLDLNRTYEVQAISNTLITGYELAAWCYCSFMGAFPQMADKLQLPYSAHYEKAKAMI